MARNESGRTPLQYQGLGARFIFEIGNRLVNGAQAAGSSVIPCREIIPATERNYYYLVML